MLLGHTCIPIFIEQVVVKSLHCFQLICLEKRSSLIEGSIGWIGSNNCIVQTTILVSIQHLRARNLIGETERTAIRNARCTHLTLLGSYEDNTIGSTGTINGSRSILQYRDTLYLRGIQVVESLSTEVLVTVTNLYIVRIDITIDNEERLLGCRTNFAQ